jgi:hypothetical protein
MKKKILIIGSVTAILLLVLASLTSVVGSQVTRNISESSLTEEESFLNRLKNIVLEPSINVLFSQRILDSNIVKGLISKIKNMTVIVLILDFPLILLNH